MKIIAIASAGGHWIQLLRLMPAFDGHEVIFMSTNPSFKDTISDHEFLCVPDGNRWNKFKLILLALNIGRKVIRIKPDIIITTGAAPGLFAIVFGKLIGSKTLWLDSIANVEKVSLSGKIAVFFADKVHTQWKSLANSKITYAGNVLS